MAGGVAVNGMMSFEEGWQVLQKEAIVRLIHNLELGSSCQKLFTPEEYMRFYTITYNMATSDNLVKEKLFVEYRKTIEEYTSSKVLPSLRCCENENLLKEFLRRWSNHQIMIKWLSRFFLGKIMRASSSLLGSIHLAFYGRAYAEIKDQISGAIVKLVDKQREGEEIDKAMVEQVLDVIQEIGEDALRHYSSCIRSAIFCSPEAETATATATAFYESIMKDIEKEIARVSECSSSPTNNEKLLKAYREIKERVGEALAPLMDKRHHKAVRNQIHDKIATILNECQRDALRIFGKDIEDALIKATARFYSKKALVWMATMSYEDYVRKVEECLEKEKGRVSDYLRITKEEEILKVVQHELLNVHAHKLEEMEITSRLKLSTI